MRTATTAARAAAAYRLVVPSGWRRVPLDASADGAVDDLVRAALAGLPGGTPPDDLARLRVQLRGRLVATVRAARARGGTDLFLDPGTALSLVVGLRPAEGAAPAVVAALLASDPGAAAVDVGPLVAVRTVERAADGWQRVVHLVPPLDGGWWAVLTAEVPEHDLLVELVDAVVSTWRWEA